MRITSKFFAVAAFAVSATAAQAQLYGEIGYMPLKITATVFEGGNTLTVKASPSVLGLTLGYGIHKNVAVEVMVAFSAKDDSAEVNGISTPVDVKVNNAHGIFVKPKAMLSEKFEVFGRLGYMNSKISASGLGGPVSDTSDGFAYGIGANYYLNTTTYLTASYMNLYNKNDVKVTGFALGVGMKF